MGERVNYTKTKGRILRITKDDMRFCSSRCIIGEVLCEETNETYHISWAETPVVIGPSGVWYGVAPEAFKRTWNESEVGSMVWIYHCGDQNYRFIEPV